MSERTDKIARVQAVLGPAVDEVRRAAARRTGDVYHLIDAAVRSGESIRSATARLSPGTGYAFAKKQLQAWRLHGEDAFYDTRLPPRRGDLPVDLHEQIVAFGRVFPSDSADQIAARLAERGMWVSASTVTVHLRNEGLSRPVGRPTGTSRATRSSIKGRGDTRLGAAADDAEDEVREVDHPLAGAELLAALDDLDGGTLVLAKAALAHAESLPPPTEAATEPPGSRDERGRFRPAYNATQPRRFTGLNARFESVGIKRLSKDPARFRFLSTAVGTVRLKMRALTFLPLVTVRGKFSELDHGIHERLGVLVGRDYRPATLDKFAREQKYAGSGHALQEAWMNHVLARDGEAADAQTGAVVLYGDATTHPHWTDVFERATHISKRGKVMPGVSTVTLHTGVGTPIHYQPVSGHASMPKIVLSMLKEYEADAGPETATRIVVMDRESHAVDLFKELGAIWRFIIPLRTNVTGPKAVFSERTPWTAWGERGEVCEATLVLKDNRKGEKDLTVRVVGLRRHPGGSVFWFATNCAPSPFTPAHIVRLYFQRWPMQELQFRDAAGHVAIHQQHGYGKEEVENVAVVTRLETMNLAIAHLDDEVYDLRCEVEWGDQRHDDLKKAAKEAERAERTATDRLGRAVVQKPAEAAEAHAMWSLARAKEKTARKELLGHEKWLAKARARHKPRAARLDRLRAEAADLETRRRIFKLDTDLDDVMLAPKCMFIRLCASLQAVMGTRMEIDTLIARVLTLPGRKRTTKDGRIAEVILYRNPLDPEIGAPIATAIAELNRRLGCQRFRVVDRPAGSIR